VTTVVQCVNNLDVGGVETLVLGLSAELSHRGSRVKICCIEDEGGLAPEARSMGVEVRALNMADRGKYRALREFRAYLRSDAPIVIHSHNFKPGWYASAARGLGIVQGHVHTKHGVYSASSRGLWRYRLMRVGVDAFVAVSQESRDQLARLASVRAERVAIVSNGVDIALCQPSSRREALRAELGIPPDRRIVVNVARLSPEKDLGSLLHAFRRIHDTLARTELWLIGDGPERGRLEALASDLEIAQCVTFMGMRADVPRLLPAADLFCLSSLSEGLPIALLEAMACGLPIVATSVGDVPRALLGDLCGLVVPPNDPYLLAVTCLDLLQDGARRAQMGTRSRSRAVDSFSLGVMAAEYARLYDETLTGRLLPGGAP
jgi:glycosyltransferase involved in cell wall biosynthesis